LIRLICVFPECRLGCIFAQCVLTRLDMNASIKLLFSNRCCRPFMDEFRRRSPDDENSGSPFKGHSLRSRYLNLSCYLTAGLNAICVQYMLWKMNHMRWTDCRTTAYESSKLIIFDCAASEHRRITKTNHVCCDRERSIAVLP
jgi:hypothetical protein